MPDELLSVCEPVLYLETLFGPTLAEAFGLRLVELPEDWLPRLPEMYRRRSIQLTTLGEARTLSDPMFVKPPNEKSFPAKVYRGEELPTEFPEEMAVLVAEPVSWEREFRCFLLDRKLMTFSVYLRDSKLQRECGFATDDHESAEVTKFVGSILKNSRIDLPKATVLDVGVIRDRGWAVVEQNAAWGSGLYGCDPEKVLEVLQWAAV